MAADNETGMAIVPASSGAIEDALDAVEVTGWRARAAKVILRLIAGSEVGAAIYGEARENLDTIDGKSLVNHALAQAVAKQAVDDPEVMDRAKARFLGDMYRKQENLEAVIEKSQEHLEQFMAIGYAPSSDGEGSTAEQLGTGDHDKKSETEVNQEVDDDWTFNFAGIAESASSAELQDRLARILAGEIISPGKYPRTVVRAISELNRDDILSIKKMMPFIWQKDIITDENSGPIDYETLVHLADIGVIITPDSTLTRSYHRVDLSTRTLTIVGKEYGLILVVKEGATLSTKISPLTRTGLAIIELIGEVEEEVVIKNLAKSFKDSCEKITLGKKTKDGTKLMSVEHLHPEPEKRDIGGFQFGHPFGPVNLVPEAEA